MEKFVVEFKWGIIFAFVGLLWMVIERIAGLHSTHIGKHQYFTNLYAIPAIAVYVLALLDIRKHSYDGYMTYFQGFKSGLIVTLVVTVLSPISQLLISWVISPNYFQNAISYVVDTGKMSLEEAEDYFNIRSYIFQGIVGAPVMGTVTSAVVALFTRKNSNHHTNLTRR